MACIEQLSIIITSTFDPGSIIDNGMLDVIITADVVIVKILDGRGRIVMSYLFPVQSLLSYYPFVTAENSLSVIRMLRRLKMDDSNDLHKLKKHIITAAELLNNDASDDDDLSASAFKLYECCKFWVG